MKSKIATLTLLLACIMPIPLGCSLNDKPGNTNPPEEMTQVLRKRVKYVTAFAFQLNKIKPHRAAVCQFADQLGTFLDGYDDKDASFAKLQAAVNQYVNRIQDPVIRDVVLAITDMALTEAFNYTWTHYKDLINQNETKMSLLIAGAVANGLRDACDMTSSTIAP